MTSLTRCQEGSKGAVTRKERRVAFCVWYLNRKSRKELGDHRLQLLWGPCSTFYSTLAQSVTKAQTTNSAIYKHNPPTENQAKPNLRSQHTCIYVSVWSSMWLKQIIFTLSKSNSCLAGKKQSQELVCTVFEAPNTRSGWQKATCNQFSGIFPLIDSSLVQHLGVHSAAHVNLRTSFASLDAQIERQTNPGGKPQPL